MLRLAHGILVADHEEGSHFVAEFQQAVIGIAAKNKADVAFLERRRNVRNALDQKSIGPQIGIRIKRHGRKERDHRLAQRVRRLNRHVERGIVDTALRALHPVNNTGAVGIGSALAPHADTRIFEKLFRLFTVLILTRLKLIRFYWERTS